MKVAILQKKSFDRQPLQNTELALETMENAAADGADILLLPEAFLTGYVLPMSNEEALADNNPFLPQICRAARTLRLGVVATAITQGPQKPQNSAFVVDKNGQVLMKYSKVHTCDFADEACLAGGDAFRVCDFHGIRLGIMICYDREYPESARVRMTDGLYYAAFDMEAIRRYREREMLGNTFRKVKAYRALLSDQIEYPFLREHQRESF